MDRFEEMMSLVKMKDFIHRQELEEEKKKTVCLVFAIIAGILAIGMIAYGIYKFVSGDKDEDEDDFDFDFEDDFEDEDSEDSDDEEDDFVDEDKAAPKADTKDTEE